LIGDSDPALRDQIVSVVDCREIQYVIVKVRLEKAGRVALGKLATWSLPDF